MEISKIREKLSSGVVSFKYIKNDGSIRSAKGTTNLDSIGESYVAKGNGAVSPKDYGLVSYFDIDKKGWRCFNPSKLVEMEGVV